MASDEFKNKLNRLVDVGGWHCPCCGPDNSHDKKLLRRLARHQLKQDDERMAREDEMELDEQE